MPQELRWQPLGAAPGPLKRWLWLVVSVRERTRKGLEDWGRGGGESRELKSNSHTTVRRKNHCWSDAALKPEANPFSLLQPSCGPQRPLLAERAKRKCPLQSPSPKNTPRSIKRWIWNRGRGLVTNSGKYNCSDFNTWGNRLKATVLAQAEARI